MTLVCEHDGEDEGDCANVHLRGTVRATWTAERNDMAWWGAACRALCVVTNLGKWRPLSDPPSFPQEPPCCESTPHYHPRIILLSKPANRHTNERVAGDIDDKPSQADISLLSGHLSEDHANDTLPALDFAVACLPS